MTTTDGETRKREAGDEREKQDTRSKRSKQFSEVKTEPPDDDVDSNNEAQSRLTSSGVFKEDIENGDDQVDDGPPLNAAQIKAMMANARQLIAKRKVELNISETPVIDEKARRAAELQARIASGLNRVGLENPIEQGRELAQGVAERFGIWSRPVHPVFKPMNPVAVRDGRVVDLQTGESIDVRRNAPTLKANVRAEKRQEFRTKFTNKGQDEMGKDVGYFDSRLKVKGAGRSKRSLKFNEPGKYQKMATQLRTKAQLERLQSSIANNARRTGISVLAAKAKATAHGEIIDDEVHPSIEWWDAVFLGVTEYPDLEEDEQIDFSQVSGITSLVEHPIQMKPPAEPPAPLGMTLYLTRRETKKLRRQTRKENQKEEQEKIRLGLKKPPEPKLKMANFMRSLTDDAIMNPSEIEKKVRAQMAKRQKAHKDANAARKLSAQQKRDKVIKKITEDVTHGVHVSVYRVHDLSDPSIKFKVEANCKQLHMTGFVALFKNCNVVAVEGGPKQQKKFRQLMLRRIKWPEVEGGADETEDASKSAYCRLLWQGTVPERSFGEIVFKLCPTESFAREQFRRRHVESYWDLCFNAPTLEIS